MILIVLKILAAITFVVMLASIVVINYLIGYKYDHGRFGALLGVILAFLLVSIVIFY